MANSSTLIQSLPIGLKNKGFTSIKQYAVVLDTTGADLTIHTTTSGYRAILLALLYSEADAHTLTFKSASTTLVALEMPANSGRDQPMDLTPIITKEGENLVARVATSGIATMLVLVAEFQEIKTEMS